MDPAGIVARPSLPRHFQAMGVVVDARDLYVDTALPAPPAQHPEIIPAAATDLADMYPLPVVDKRGQAADADRMPAQPGIDDIQFQHISFNIRKRKSFPIQQLLFRGSP